MKDCQPGKSIKTSWWQGINLQPQHSDNLGSHGTAAWEKPGVFRAAFPLPFVTVMASSMITYSWKQLWSVTNVTCSQCVGDPKNNAVTIAYHSVPRTIDTWQQRKLYRFLTGVLLGKMLGEQFHLMLGYDLKQCNQRRSEYSWVVCLNSRLICILSFLLSVQMPGVLLHRRSGHSNQLCKKEERYHEHGFGWPHL